MKKIIFLILFALFIIHPTSEAKKLYAWGSNYYGLLGNGSSTYDQYVPVQIGSETNWSKIACGWYHTVAIKNDGTLWAWGLNFSGQLGDGTTIDKHTPIQIGSETNWSKIACGIAHTIAIKSDGTLWAWGYNFYGELGDGTTIDKQTPLQIGSDNHWVQVACGWYHTIAIKSDGSIWAWGWNDKGQLGDGTKINRLVPVQIESATNWLKNTCNIANTLAIRNDGTLWAWGYNYYGQLGDGTTIDKLSPEQIGSELNWNQVSCGYVHTTAIKKDSTLWAWGNNNYGQLGDGTTIDKLSPEQIGAEANWTKISCGDVFTLAIKSNGSLWAWGLNEYGQLGDGTIIERYSPVQIGKGNIWSSVAGGAFHTVALADEEFVIPTFSINQNIDSIDINWNNIFDSTKYVEFYLYNDTNQTPRQYLGYSLLNDSTFSFVLSNLQTCSGYYVKYFIFNNDSTLITSNFINNEIINYKPISKPDLVFPTNHSPLYISPIYLSWDSVKKATFYEVLISKDTLFTDTSFYQNNVLDTFLLHINLVKNTNYYWHIKAKSNTCESEWSDRWAFIITDNACTLTSPNTTETLYTNKPYIITWQSGGISNVMLEYTTNASSTSTSWTTITANTSATLGYYLWTIPDTPSSDCKVRISNASNSFSLDVSDTVFTISPCYGYNEWTIYLLENGKLPNNFVNAMIAEPSGTKWIATGNGLVKITSSNSTTYTTSNSTLPDNQIICMAKNGNYLWLGTYSGGLSCLDIASNSFTNFNSPAYPLPSNSINTIAVESGTIWIGTDNGLISYDSSTWTIYRKQNVGMPDNNILDIKIDALGNKWIGTYSGLVKLNSSSSFTYTVSNSGLPNNIIRKIYIDNANTLYIAAGFDNGLTMFDGSTSWTQWTTSNSGLPSNFITAIGIDYDGNKWFGTNKGVGIFDAVNWTYYNTANSKLPNNIILCFAYEYNEDKWMGTQGGLAKLGGCSQTFSLPPWNVTNYTGHNASIIIPTDCIISLCGLDQIENGDAIGVFYSDNGLLKCGGYSIYSSNENIAITAWGDNNLTTEKDGFSPLEKYTFMIWDASKSEEKLASVTFKAGSNDYYYDDKVSEAQNISALCNQIRINLYKDKKNLISSNYTPQSSKIEDIMSGVLQELKLMKNDRGFIYYPSYSINQINYWDMKNGYQVEMNNDATLLFNGSPIDPTDYPIELDAKKWYLIPYLAPTTFLTTHALSSIWNNIFQLKDDEGNIVFLPWFFDKDIQYMYPFKGYKLSLINNDTLIYPLFAPASNPIIKGKRVLSSGSANILTTKYITNISGTGSTSILMIEGDNFADGDEIGVFTSTGLLVGSSVVSNSMAVIKVWGDNTTTSAIEGATENETLKLKYWSSVENIEYNLYTKDITDVLLNAKVNNPIKYNEDATYQVSVIKSLNSVNNEINQIQLSINNIPNPFTESTVFKYSIPNDGYVKISICNLLGNPIATICDKWQPAGEYEIVFDSANLESGMYIYKLTFDKELITNKMILMK